MIYWATPNHPTERGYRKGTHNHPFMRQIQNCIINFHIKGEKGQKVSSQWLRINALKIFNVKKL